MDTLIITPAHKDYPDAARRINKRIRPRSTCADYHYRAASQKTVAIVGTGVLRRTGRQVTKIAKELAEQGIVIISGLAFGADAAAHRACLDAGGIICGRTAIAGRNAHARGARQAS